MQNRLKLLAFFQPAAMSVLVNQHALDSIATVLALPSDAIFFVQAYGGTTSIMIGSYSWSVDSFNPSAAQSGDTYCSSCAVDVSDVTIINSSAVSNTTGKQSVKSKFFSPAFCSFCAVLTIVFLCCNGCRIDLHA